MPASHPAPIPDSAHFPLVGATFHYVRNPLKFLEGASKLGDLVRLPFFHKPAFLVSTPALLDQVLVKSASHFQKDMFLRALKRILGEGLLSSEGDFWKRQRRLIQPAFHRDRIAGYAKVMTDRTTQALAGWRDGEAFDVHHALMQLTAEIVTDCLFGTNAGDVGEVASCLDTVMERFSNPLYLVVPAIGELPLPANRRFQEVAPRLDRIVRGFIEQRRAQGASAPGNDLLAMLLEARDEDGSSMSDKQVRDEVLILFLAGHETTALSLSWTLHELSENPHVEQRLHEEIERVLGGRTPTFEDLPKLEYTARVVNESLRLHPPAWSLGRESTEPFDLAGHHFEKGTWMWMMPYLIHRDPRWFVDPLVFRPERWEDGLAKKLPKLAYLPFGAGPRVCIGNQFALMETALVLATIAQRFRLRTVPGHRVVADPAITLRFKHGLKMNLAKRTPSAAASAS
jgi:cytochrome P450